MIRRSCPARETPPKAFGADLKTDPVAFVLGEIVEKTGSPREVKHGKPPELAHTPTPQGEVGVVVAR